MHNRMSQIAKMDDARAENPGQVFFRLLGYLRPYKKELFGVLGLVLLSAAAQALGPFLIGRAIDQFITVGDRAGLSITMFQLLGVYVLGMLAMRYQIYIVAVTGQSVLRDMRTMVMGRVQTLSLQYIEGKEAGDLMSRLVNDIDAINAFFSQALAQTIGSLFALTGIIIAMFVLNWQLALAALAIVPVMILTTGQFAKWAREAFRRTRTTIGDVSADLQEELGGVKVAQAFNRTERNVKDFQQRNARNRDANVSANAVTSAFAPAMDVLSTLDTAIIAGYGGYLAVNGVVTVGLVVAFLQYVQNFFRPIQTISQMYTVAQAALAAAERVFELLDTQPDIVDATDALALPTMRGRLQFEDVTFAYEPGKDVIRNVSLEAQPGETIAVVGPTGAGKSTLVNLISRFYDVQQGRIRIDGYAIHTVTRHSLRSQMGVVLQDPFLFSGTILENIRYGRLNATDEDVIAAAQAANADSFITRLPKGYETEVGERGGMLSQGQRQLIAIARAILANPRLLILDEATASVDTRTEALIQSALENLLEERTSFVIAHRLSTIRNADQVLVMDHGKIVERGTHESLMKDDGLYAELYARQFYVPPEERAAQKV